MAFFFLFWFGCLRVSHAVEVVQLQTLLVIHGASKSTVFISFWCGPPYPIFSSRPLFFFPFSQTPNSFKLSSLGSSSFSSSSSSSTEPPISPTNPPWPDPQLSCFMMRLIWSGATFTYSVKNAISSSHCLFVCASSVLRLSLSFFSFSFSSDKSANCAVVVVSTDPGFFESGDDVEVDPRSSPEFVGDDVPPPADFPPGRACAVDEVVVLRRRISDISSLCPRLKYSFANSHLSGTIFLKPCETPDN